MLELEYEGMILIDFFFGGSCFSFYVILKDTGDITGNGVRASWFRFVLSFPILFYSVLGRIGFFLYWGIIPMMAMLFRGWAVSSMTFRC